jgi:hypothetical protein
VQKILPATLSYFAVHRLVESLQEDWWFKSEGKKRKKAAILSWHGLHGTDLL